MVPVDEAEIKTAGDESEAAVLERRIVQHDLNCDLKVRGEEGPEDGVLVIAICGDIGRFREDLIISRA